MNKKEAVAYAQITLNHMQNPNYNDEINIETLGIEMRQAFKLYPRNLVVTIADSQIQSFRKLNSMKNGSDNFEWNK